MSKPSKIIFNCRLFFQVEKHGLNQLLHLPTSWSLRQPCSFSLQIPQPPMRSEPSVINVRLFYECVKGHHTLCSLCFSFLKRKHHLLRRQHPILLVFLEKNSLRTQNSVSVLLLLSHSQHSETLRQVKKNQRFYLVHSDGKRVSLTFCARGWRTNELGVRDHWMRCTQAMGNTGLSNLDEVQNHW